MKQKRHHELLGKLSKLLKSIPAPTESISEVANAFLTLCMGIAFSTYLINSWFIAKNLNELTAPLYLTVVCLMSFNFIMRPITSMLFGAKLSKHSLILQFLATFLLVNVIENDATTIIDNIMANQQLSLMVLAGVVIAFAINYVLPIRLIHTEYRESRMGEARLMKAQSSISPTERDINTAAIHEAGHALIYSAAEGIPDSFKVVLNDKNRSDATLGQVTCPRSGHFLNTGTELDFEMLLKLGGLAAELAVFGEHADGGRSDIDSYQNLARHYLKAGYSELPYYNEPESQLEVDVNCQSINVLKEEYLTKLVAFMEANKLLLVELSEVLKDKEMLQIEDLLPFFEKSVIPDWMPRVNLS